MLLNLVRAAEQLAERIETLMRLIFFVQGYVKQNRTRHEFTMVKLSLW